MHLYLFARGKFEQVEQWKAHAQCAYWKFRRINLKTKKQETIIVQGALRPSVLGTYEYVFPEESLAEVCAFFGITKNESYGFNKIGLYTRHFCLRKIFGCKKIPKKILEKAKKIPSTFTTAEFERGCSNCIIPGVSLHAIGIKEDEKRDFKEWGYFQEAL
jgi:hypothetical protein